MKTGECNGGFQPAGWKADDGRLWFLTMKGLAVVDPRRVANGGTPLPVIERAFIDGREVDPTSGVEIPPGRGNWNSVTRLPTFDHLARAFSATS